jgi:thiamine biosynthesis protein ThiS
MNIFLNGKPHIIADGLTVGGLITQQRLEGQNIVVEVNKTIVPREEFASHTLAHYDAIEILRFVGGG